jgi:hypothetical protein
LTKSIFMLYDNIDFIDNKPIKGGDFLMVKYLCVLFIMVIAFSYCAFAYVGAGNLVNGDFESGFTGWSAYHAVTTWVLGARTGGSGAWYSHISTTVAGGSIYQTETRASTNGDWWRLTGWVRMAVGNTGNFGFFGTLSPYSPASTNAVITGNGNWVFYTVKQKWTIPNDYANGYRDVQLAIDQIGNADLDDVATYDQGTVPASLIDFTADWSLK